MPSAPVALLLDLSVYQLLFLERVPDYAVIHEAVRLCEERQKGAKGMVNAVLRRVQRTELADTGRLRPVGQKHGF